MKAFQVTLIADAESEAILVFELNNFYVPGRVKDISVSKVTELRSQDD